MTKMKVAYLRVSSDEQRERQTIASQRTELRKVCESRGIKLDKFYEDDGVSGTVPLHNRPHGRVLWDDVAAGRVGEIYVLKHDRLGRTLRSLLNLDHRLARFGVTVEAITQPLPKGITGEAMRQMLGVFAEFDRKNILENTWRGLTAKARKGGWTGGPPPFGYRLEGTKQTARLVLHPEYSRLVRLLFERAADGDSCQVLADYLNRLGIPPARQNPNSLWRPNSVRVILTNPTYTGTRQFGRRQWIKVEDENGNITTHLKKAPDERIIPSTCPAIVDQELWKRANAALHKNQITAMAHAKVQYLLRGLVRCGICGKGFIGCGKQYACIGRHCARRLYGKDQNGQAKHRCPAPLVHRDELEATIWDLCADYISNPGKLVLELALQRAKERNPARQRAQEIADLKKVLEREEQKRCRAQNLLTDGAYDRAAYDRQILRSRAASEPAEARLQELLTIEETLAERERAEQNVRTALEGLRLKRGYSFEDKRHIVEQLVKAITVESDGNCRIDFRFHFEGPGWPRRQPITKDEVDAGAEGVRVALGATLQRSDSRVANTLPRNASGVWRRSCAWFKTLVTAMPTRDSIIHTSASGKIAAWLNSM
jgi:site-specific DNA recombinase